jgi:hypothetical protein
MRLKVTRAWSGLGFVAELGRRDDEFHLVSIYDGHDSHDWRFTSHDYYLFSGSRQIGKLFQSFEPG